jgi:hypothetical protein
MRKKARYLARTENLSATKIKKVAAQAIKECDAAYQYAVKGPLDKTTAKINEIGHPTDRRIYDQMLVRVFQDVRMKLREKLAAGAYGMYSEGVRNLLEDGTTQQLPIQ